MTSFFFRPASSYPRDMGASAAPPCATPENMGPNTSSPYDTYSEDALVAIYTEMAKEDAGVASEAVKANWQVQGLPYDEIDNPLAAEEGPGMVNRRAPLNPLTSPRLGIYRKGKFPKAKMQDPALKNTPLRGRLVMTLTSSAVLLFVFLQA